MSKKKKNLNKDLKQVKSINKNVRSSTRKLSQILRALVGKKVAFEWFEYLFLNSFLLKVAF